MHLLALPLLAMAFILIAGCSSVSTQPGQAIDPTKTLNTTEKPAAITPSAPFTASTQNPTPQEVEKRLAPESLQDLVVMDLARILGVEEEKIVVVQINTALWNEARLGCVERKGLHEATPMPGYKIFLEYGGQTYEYHTDEVGNFRLCMPPPKPLDPIK